MQIDLNDPNSIDSLDVIAEFDHKGEVDWQLSEEASVELPPLIAVAYFDYAEKVPETWKENWLMSKLRGPAYAKIFKTGNPKPAIPLDTTADSLARDPDVHGGTASLARLRASREFRAALWMPQIRMYRLSGRTTVSLSGYAEVGYTAPAKEPSQRGRNDRYDRGKRILNRPTVEWYSWGARVYASIGFRIAKWWAEIGTGVLFKGRPIKAVPYMMLSVKVDLKMSKPSTARFNGSHIPSQVYQLGQATSEHSMVCDVRHGDIIRALSAGHERPAELRPKWSLLT